MGASGGIGCGAITRLVEVVEHCRVGAHVAAQIDEGAGRRRARALRAAAKMLRLVAAQHAGHAVVVGAVGRPPPRGLQVRATRLVSALIEEKLTSALNFGGCWGPALLRLNDATLELQRRALCRGHTRYGRASGRALRLGSHATASWGGGALPTSRCLRARESLVDLQSRSRLLSMPRTVCMIRRSTA